MKTEQIIRRDSADIIKMFMNQKTISLLFCLLCWFSTAYGQEPVPINIDDLPKINANDLQGEIREKVLRSFDCQPAECEWYRVVKVEQQSLSETDVYLVITSDHSAGFALQFKEKFYVSAKKNDFEKFLKDYQILAKANFSDAFLDVYRYFKFNDAAIHPFYIVSATYRTKYIDDLKRYETGYQKIPYRLINSPKIIKTGNGSTKIEFYADNPSFGEIKKINAVLSSKYTFKEKVVSYRLEKPMIID